MVLALIAGPIMLTVKPILEIRKLKKHNDEIREKIRQYKIDVDRSVGDLSKKVDSRVDKAIESMKKQLGN